jgi:hypothetical protein
MFPAVSVSSAAPHSAATPAEISSLCDRVNVAMSSSKIGRRKKSAKSEIQWVALSRDAKNPNAVHFDAFRVFFKIAAIFAAATLRSDARRRSSANICAKCAYSLADLDALHALAKKNAQPWIITKNRVCRSLPASRDRC